MSVDIFNSTTVTVKISEGSVGVYRLMGLIVPDDKFVLRVDKNSTYREYLLTTESENLPVGSSLTSDDVLEYSKIEIKEIVTLSDGPVWIGFPNVKRRGLISRLLGFDQSVKIKIVNCLEEQHVKIEERNTGADQPTADRRKVDPSQVILPQGNPSQVDLSQGNPSQGDLPQGNPSHGDLPQANPSQGDPLQGDQSIKVHTIAPGKTISLSVDPNDTHRDYHLTIDNSTLGHVRVKELKELSKIEITNTRKNIIGKAFPEFVREVPQFLMIRDHRS